MQFVNEASDALIAVRKAILSYQVLPDGHRIAPTLLDFDELAIRLTTAEGLRFAGLAEAVVAGLVPPESVNTSMAGFATWALLSGGLTAFPGSESVNTSMAGFAARPRLPGCRT